MKDLENIPIPFSTINDNNLINWLYVLVMLRTRFRVNPHSIVTWMSRNSLFEAALKSETEVTATGLEPATT